MIYNSLCLTCWKAWIWACPIGRNCPRNITSCTAYESSEVFLKEQELNLKFYKELCEIFNADNRTSELIKKIKEYEEKK